MIYYYTYLYIYNTRTVSFLAQITSLRYYTKGKVEHSIDCLRDLDSPLDSKIVLPVLVFKTSFSFLASYSLLSRPDHGSGPD